MAKKNNINNNPVDSILPFLSSSSPNLSSDYSTERNIEEVRKTIPIQNRNKFDKNGNELKRKRYNLLFIPSLYRNIEKIAYVENESVNEAINQAIALYIDSKKDILAKYNEIEMLKKG